MKKRIAWLLMSCLVVLSLMLASCAKPAPINSTTPTAPTSPTTPTAPTTPTTPATTAEPTAGETLDEILGRAEGITSMKYDLVATVPGAPATTSKVWVKKNKRRIETTGTAIILLIDIDARTTYQYIPAQNAAMKMPFVNTGSIMEEVFSMSKSILNIVGTESIDGKVCLVSENFVPGGTLKFWIWKEHGLPIRMEQPYTGTDQPPGGKYTEEHKNFEFVDIPDSMFEPPGVQYYEYPGM